MIAEVNALSESNVILVEDPRQIELASYGIQGPRGYSVLSGNGLPASTLGINNDLYINFSTGYMYKKLANVWVYQAYVTPQQKKFVISAVDVAAKQIVLDPPPQSEESVILEFIGGTTQDNGDDFEVTGNVLSWSGLGLDGFIEENDVIIVRY